MKKTCICCVLCFCITLTGCTRISSKDYIPLSTYLPGSKLYADTMGLLEAFTENEELRTLFEQAASGSIPLADLTKSDQYYYDYYMNGTKAYYGDAMEGFLRMILCVWTKKLVMRSIKSKNFCQEFMSGCARWKKAKKAEDAYFLQL